MTKKINFTNLIIFTIILYVICWSVEGKNYVFVFEHFETVFHVFTHKFSKYSRL